PPAGLAARVRPARGRALVRRRPAAAGREPLRALDRRRPRARPPARGHRRRPRIGVPGGLALPAGLRARARRPDSPRGPRGEGEARRRAGARVGRRAAAALHTVARAGIGWPDASSRLEGPIVDDVAAHLGLRWREVTGETLDPVANEPQGDVRLQFVRTVPNGVYDALPRGDFRILQAYVRALRSAERLVYLESQFLWSPELVRSLVEKLRNPPSDEFHVVVLLPARANNGQDNTRGQL